MSNKKCAVLELAAQLTPEALKAARTALRNASRKDPELKKAVVKTYTKISSDIRKEKLIEENPEILQEVERRKADKEKKRLAKSVENAKEEQRKQELRDARALRKQKEEEDKNEKIRTKLALFNDANLSEETRVRIKKAEIYPRRHSDGTLLSVKVLVSYADADGKWQFKDSIKDVPEGMPEEEFLKTAREELISLLVDVENT